MCGIAAIINLSPLAPPVAEEDLRIMQYQLRGRGPDSSGIWIESDRTIGFGIRRLSTQDARPIANQPVWSFDRSVVVIFNGEIYNHPELREELEDKGCVFKTRSDTEVLANGFRVYGKEILQKIQGQFAFAAFDRQSKEVLIGRDPFGICPLYYTVFGGQLILASTVKAILELKRIPRRLDHQAVYDFFVMDSVGRERTFFDGVSYLRAGFYLHFKVNKPITKSRYYRLNGSLFEPDTSLSESQWVDAAREVLFTAVKRCMLGDKEVGVYLSGGIDSVSVMALVRKIFPDRQVKTFSAGFAHVLTGEPVGEIDFAKKMAAYFQTKHHEVIVDAGDIVNDIGKFDLPTSSIIDTVIKKLAKTASEAGVNVALSGEGADEIFFGYDHFMAAVGFLASDFKWLNKRYYLRGNYANSLDKNMAVLEDVFLGGGADIDLDMNRKAVFQNHGKTLSIRSLVRDIRAEALKANSAIELDKQLIYIDYSQKVPENLLRRAEGPSMGQGVEMRFPLLWDDLIRFLYRMPMAIRIADGTTKYILRKIVSGLIPEEAMNRPKSPFGLPAARRFQFKGAGLDFKKPALKHFFWKYYERVAEALMDGSFRKENLFASDFIQNLLFQQNDKQRCNFNSFLWKLWNFAEWYDSWITIK